jgi:heterodisulfide reductase subunit C
MQTTDQIMEMAGHRQEDFSVCMGCKVCASVCTVNDLAIDMNPQEFLLKVFMGEEIKADHPLVRYCTSCYRCTSACPWQIRIPEVVRAFKETLGVASPFEKAFKGSVAIWGRVYEPYIFLRAASFMIKEGYLKYMPRWTEYVGFHLPHKVKRK